MSYTPGPWTWDARRYRLTAPPGNVVVLCPFLDQHRYGIGAALSVLESDARLIAAAPDLLEALKACHLALGTSDRSWAAKQQRADEAFKAATAAIAKAEGTHGR